MACSRPRQHCLRDQPRERPPRTEAAGRHTDEHEDRATHHLARGRGRGRGRVTVTDRVRVRGLPASWRRVRVRVTVRVRLILYRVTSQLAHSAAKRPLDVIMKG